jgi:hypothetical protein
MRTIFQLWTGLILVGTVGAASTNADDKSDRSAVKALLEKTSTHLEDRVKDDDDACIELTKLKTATDATLDRMVRDIKVRFEVDKLDADSVKRVHGEVRKAIETAKPADLKKAIKGRDATVIPNLCWLWGCP